jgi:hypothetical protein
MSFFWKYNIKCHDWAMTGERRYLGRLFVSAKHWVDVDICHAQRKSVAQALAATAAYA